MKYIVVNVGCLCCDTPSSVVGLVSEPERAQELCDFVNYGMRDTRFECRYFCVHDEEHVDPAFDNVIEQGKKYKAKQDEKWKAHMARRNKTA